MVNVDTVFELLESERRRHALYYLDEQETPVSLDAVAEHVREVESDEGATDESATDRDTYKVSLGHTHLPKADENAEFIEFDADDGEVRLTGEPPTYESILAIAKVLERPN